jgi:site-specific recombinase XerD
MADNFGRNTVYPIRNKKDLEDCFVYLRREINKVDGNKHPTQKWIKTRNYLLKVKVKHINAGFIQLREQKTGKIQQIPLNKDVINNIKRNYLDRFDLDEDSYMFASREGFNKPMTRQNVSTIIKDIAKNLGWTFPVNTHTMRKTFGYHYYKATGDAVGLQKMLNHGNSRTTLIYIGMVQEEVDNARKAFKIDP